MIALATAMLASFAGMALIMAASLYLVLTERRGRKS